MVLADAHDRKSSWRRATGGAPTSLIRRSSNSQTTPNKEEFPSRQKIYLSDFFQRVDFEFIDTEQRFQEESNFERKMAKKRKSKILDDDEFREAYGFVRRNSMTARTRILTRQAKVSSRFTYRSFHPMGSRKSFLKSRWDPIWCSEL